MALTDIDRVRLKIADKATLHREEWDADGTTSDVRLEYSPILSVPAFRAWRNNVLLAETADYVVDRNSGLLSLVALPTNGDRFIFQYSSVVFSDDEITDFLGSAGGSVRLTAYRLLYAWAADASRMALKETRSGGGGLGSVTIDTSVRAREMRLTADAYMKEYDRFEGTGDAVEQITEIPWTPPMADRMIVNKIIEELG